MNIRQVNADLSLYLYHEQASYRAADVSARKVIGYVLAKTEEEPRVRAQHGHVISLALGIAAKLMATAFMSRVVDEWCGARYISLHVRKSNRAAFIEEEGDAYLTEAIENLKLSEDRRFLLNL
ncbi:hypothetical protein V1520DRAFT_371130 [Lipomyces starkeyi]